VSGQLLASTALSPGNEPLIPTGKEAAWAREPVWMLCTREKYRPLPGIELLFSVLATRCLVTINTELFRIDLVRSV
jgi:hypothetical protein